jgi:hypothetical protein
MGLLLGVRRIYGVSMKRLGLSESLEDYARRLGASPDVARPFWRRDGLRLLNAIHSDHMPLSIVSSGRCRVAVGVVVETKPVVWE